MTSEAHDNNRSSTAVDTPNGSTGWFADPFGKWASRWFDGSAWTDQVSDGVSIFSDELDVTNQPGRATPTRPPARQRSTAATIWIVVGVVAGFAFVALIGLIVVGIALGTEDDGATDDGASDEPVESAIDSDVDGANIAASFESIAGRTTWFAVVEPGIGEAELERIATDIVSLPEAADVETLDVLFFDDGGRDLELLIDASIELDDLASADDPDFERILALSSVFGSNWVADHSVATLTPATTSMFELCAQALGTTCSTDQTVTIVAE